MMTGLPRGLKILLWVQLAVALLFLALGWSQTSSLRFGRTPSFADMVALGAPLVLVVAAAFLASSFARKGQAGTAQLIAWSPLPLAILLAMLVGVV